MSVIDFQLRRAIRHAQRRPAFALAYTVCGEALFLAPLGILAWLPEANDNAGRG